MNVLPVISAERAVYFDNSFNKLTIRQPQHWASAHPKVDNYKKMILQTQLTTLDNIITE